MSRSAVVPAAFAVVLTADVAVKLTVATAPTLQHVVTPPPAAGTVALVALLAALAWRFRLTGAALVLAGVVSNRADSFDGLVQNPLTVHAAGGVFAFNLADLAIFGGAIFAACELTVRTVRR